MREPADIGVIWDMDGTLVSSSTVVPDAFIEVVTRLGESPPDRQGVVDLYPLGDPRTMLGQMLSRPGTDEDADLYHDVLRSLVEQVAVHEGIASVLAEVRRRGVAQAVFTGNSHQAAAILLEGTGLRDFFDVVVGGNQVARAKPAPDGVLLAARGLDLPPDHCLYIGDSPLDVGAAEAAGAVPVHAGWGHLYDEALDHPTASVPADVLGFLDALADHAG
ncbi:MAG: Phosphoglycolate phosphatase [Marmoricola sp.]|nr:Phosphoglycolate phosphatase [Marmoricola sp.]